MYPSKYKENYEYKDIVTEIQQAQAFNILNQKKEWYMTHVPDISYVLTIEYERCKNKELPRLCSSWQFVNFWTLNQK
jgi:hypothetical protein